MKQRFSKALNLCFIEQYGRIPSATVLARDFNLRSDNGGSISQETARRWIRGLSMPELDKLEILAPWLGLDMDFILEKKTGQPPSNTNLTIQEPPLEHSEAKLLNAYRQADASSKRILMAIAKAILG